MTEINVKTKQVHGAISASDVLHVYGIPPCRYRGVVHGKIRGLRTQLNDKRLDHRHGLRLPVLLRLRPHTQWHARGQVLSTSTNFSRTRSFRSLVYFNNCHGVFGCLPTLRICNSLCTARPCTVNGLARNYCYPWKLV